MLRPVHTTTIARAAPVSAVRRRRVAGHSETDGDGDPQRQDGLSPFETAASGMSALLAAGGRTTPAFRAALLKLTPGGER